MQCPVCPYRTTLHYKYPHHLQKPVTIINSKDCSTKPAVQNRNQFINNSLTQHTAKNKGCEAATLVGSWQDLVLKKNVGNQQPVGRYCKSVTEAPESPPPPDTLRLG